MQSDNADGDLRKDLLGIELDEPQSADAVERSPGLDEERTAAAAGGEVYVTHDRGFVEGHDGLLAFWEERGFDPGQSHGRREEDGETDDDVGQWDGEEAQAQEDHPGAVLVVVSMVKVFLAGMCHPKCECDTDWEDDGCLLSNGVDQGREQQGLAILAG